MLLDTAILEIMNQADKLVIMGAATIGLNIALAGTAGVIISNQRKLRKELRQLREMMEKEELND